jgi:hypothetical protein
MEERAEFLIGYADKHGPVTVRGLYYQAEVAGLPGIDKTDAGYDKIQAQVLKLRRQGRLSYHDIADATRWMRKDNSYNGIEDAINETARLYRRNLWRDASEYVEVWCEKDALAGVILPVTRNYDVPLMVARGFSSETFCFEAVAAREGDPRPYIVYYLGDFDRAGQDAASSLEEKLTRFSNEDDIDVDFRNIAVTEGQIAALNLSTRKRKRLTPADLRWPYSFACELDAIDPDTMRSIVEAALEKHLPEHQMKVLRIAEEADREQLRMFAKAAVSSQDFQG